MACATRQMDLLRCFLVRGRGGRGGCGGAGGEGASMGKLVNVDVSGWRMLILMANL